MRCHGPSLASHTAPDRNTSEETHRTRRNDPVSQLHSSVAWLSVRGIQTRLSSRFGVEEDYPRNGDQWR